MAAREAMASVLRIVGRISSRTGQQLPAVKEELKYHIVPALTVLSNQMIAPKSTDSLAFLQQRQWHQFGEWLVESHLGKVSKHVLGVKETLYTISCQL
jgi:hypothetical protein